jgi:hypothetical protein
MLVRLNTTRTKHGRKSYTWIHGNSMLKGDFTYRITFVRDLTRSVLMSRR